MNKFNDVAKSVLKEAESENVFKKVSNLLSQKGLRAFEFNDVLEAVQEAINLAYKEGYKAARETPFK